MANITQFFFSGFLFLISFAPVFSNNEVRFPTKESIFNETCSLPAPDSFRITSIGGDFISLAWNPISTGALHTLVVLEETNQGGWTNFGLFQNLGGSSFTVDGLTGGNKYRFILATNCSNGDPSTLTAIVDGIALIVDLVLASRVPINPQPFSSC
ncbi:MAG: fibronectin type III domain-containing protein, partial [Saprospiraceae bacterium]|nr:fibronectin type III domain-containing protein [Saprospiraceae bacterium]